MAEANDAVTRILNGDPTAEVIDTLLEVSKAAIIGTGAAIGAGIGGYAGYKKGGTLKSTIKGAMLGGGSAALLSAAATTKVAFAAASLAKRNPLDIAIGAAGTAMGAVAVYDLIKSRGLQKESDDLVFAITHGKIVDSKSFVAKIDKSIKVATNRREVLTLVRPEFEAELKRHARLSAFFKRQMLDMAIEYFVDAINHGTNAFALSGWTGNFIIVSPRVNAHILAHEIGHIIDFRSKGITFWESPQYNSALAPYLRSTYDKTIMAAEKNAWDAAPGKNTKERQEIKKAALGTYDKGFHANRFDATATTAATLLIKAIVSLSISHLEGGHSIPQNKD